MNPETARTLAAFAGVSERTARRWRRDGIPPRFAALARLLAGELDAVAPAWSGWTLDRRGLVSPEGWTFTPGELRAVPIQYQRVAALERERLALRRRLDALAAAFVTAADAPSSWPSSPDRPSSAGTRPAADPSPFAPSP